MRYLVTGGAGFIGSYVCEYLLKEGHEVTALDDLSTGTFKNVQHLDPDPNFTCIVDSITDASTVASLVKDCDQIFHLAAAVGVELVVDHPVNTVLTNLRGAEIVLEQACRYRRKTILTSTSEVYGKSTKDKFSEVDDRVMGPTHLSRWAYAASKAMDEFLGLAYHREKQFPVVIARLFNTVGPRQTGRYGMVIPRFVSQAVRNQPITIHGTGEQTRCFCHVRDVVPALIQLMNTPEAVGEIYNVGADTEVSVVELAHLVVELTQSRSDLVKIPYDEAYGPGFEDMLQRRPDITKLRNVLGEWNPRTLEAIIEDVIDDVRKRVAADPRQA
jgi:UDP-glucose 4-epimerase